MILDCPHCHLRVGTGKDGICPNCHADVLDLSNVDPNMSVLFVRPDSVVPDICCVCGVPTSRRAKIVSHGARNANADTSGEAEGLGLFALLGMLVVPLSGLMGLSGTSRHSRVSLRVSLSVPQCDLCAGEEIKPIEVDHEKARMKLYVHKNFKADFERCNAAKQ